MGQPQHTSPREEAQRQHFELGDTTFASPRQTCGLEPSRSEPSAKNTTGKPGAGQASHCPHSPAHAVCALLLLETHSVARAGAGRCQGRTHIALTRLLSTEDPEAWSGPPAPAPGPAADAASWARRRAFSSRRASSSPGSLRHGPRGCHTRAHTHAQRAPSRWSYNRARRNAITAWGCQAVSPNWDPRDQALPRTQAHIEQQKTSRSVGQRGCQHPHEKRERAGPKSAQDTLWAVYESLTGLGCSVAARPGAAPPPSSPHSSQYEDFIVTAACPARTRWKATPPDPPRRWNAGEPVWRTSGGWEAAPTRKAPTGSTPSQCLTPPHHHLQRPLPRLGPRLGCQELVQRRWQVGDGR
jgi:hypothetical protein